MGLRFFSWRTALIAIVVIKAVLSLAVTPGSFLVSYSGISYLLLLLLGTCFAIRNGIQHTLGNRTFWVFLATAYGLWTLHQFLEIYYELGRHMEVPNDSIADTLLFLHTVPVMAAIATLPRSTTDRKLYRIFLDSLLLLFFWAFLYGYSVFPYQYLYSTSSYAIRFDIVYLIENIALVVGAGVLTVRVEAPWKPIYFHLLGASALYTLSSMVANLAIDSGGYANGKLYGLGLTAFVCWFVWVPLQARQREGSQITVGRADGIPGSSSSVWAMVAVVVISGPIAWELLQRNENTGLRTFRLLVAVCTVVCLAGAAYVREYLTRRELAHQMEKTLSSMRRKLIESQEQERARIGRELHDDINQRLALLAIELKQLEEHPSEVQPRVQELGKQLIEISDDVQALSHELHSSKLEYLGVIAGMKSWCREFAQRQNVEVDFKSELSHPLPLEIGLTLFRVLQEALHNAVKHGGVTRVEVTVWQDVGEVYLTVDDSGRGFDLEQAMLGTGLGLTSMRERVRLVDGTITIDSKPEVGTRICVGVPLQSVPDSGRDARQEQRLR